MRNDHVPRHRGGAMLLILLGILVLAAWVGADHTGRLFRLIARQRETMQRLRATDIPSRRPLQSPCEATWPAR
ncbi:MAG TPA: hypothetical protein PKM25_15635 [Candidatus Ozemobacteraceae bacterium]|nr:hypothetical protein [Candidatus Ozemobacteraceae bacterium]